MAKFKGKGVVMAGLLAGAASFLSKKENRDKAMKYLNQAKESVNKNGGMQGLMDMVKGSTTPTGDSSKKAGAMATTGKSEEMFVEETLQDVASTAGSKADSVLEGNNMLDEGGGQTTINAYNEQQDK